MKKKLISLVLLLSFSLILTGCGGSSTDSSNINSDLFETKREVHSEPQVKKSSTGICHGIGTTYYDRTTNFVPYDSIKECLDSGGRLPKK